MDGLWLLLYTISLIIRPDIILCQTPVPTPPSFQPEPIACGDTIADDFVGPELWFILQLPDAAHIILDACASNFDTVLDVYNSDLNTLIASDDDGCGTVTGQSLMNITDLPLGSYYVRLTSNTVSVGSYSLFLSCDVLTTTDSPTQAPTSFSPIGITCDEVHSAPYPMTDVWFVFQLVQPLPALVEFNACDSDFDTILQLYASNRTTLLATDDDGCGTAQGPSLLTVSSLPFGTYFIRLANNGSVTPGVDSYSLLIVCEFETTTLDPTTVEPTLPPTTARPTTPAPTTLEPTEAPTTETPTTIAPTTQPPTATAPPTTATPTTATPTTVSPTTATPTAMPTAFPTMETSTTAMPSNAPTETPATTTSTTAPTTTATPTTATPTTTAEPTTVSPTTAMPTVIPTAFPTIETSTTVMPSDAPTETPTTTTPTTGTPTPSVEPTSAAPTTVLPSTAPTTVPPTTSTTDAPTDAPTTAAPTEEPTSTPTATTTDTPTTTATPTESTAPTAAPTTEPTTTSTSTASPTPAPTLDPTTAIPSTSPSLFEPTSHPTNPTMEPTEEVPSTTEIPTDAPTISPTATSVFPTSIPTASPAAIPTTAAPTITTTPTSSAPTKNPTTFPSASPTMTTSATSPTTFDPTVSPSESPTTSMPPTTDESDIPTVSPVDVSPTVTPSASPAPTSSTTDAPTTEFPTAEPSYIEIACRDEHEALYPLSDVWFVFKLPSPAYVGLNACDSNFDTILELYASDQTTLLATDDDGCGTLLGPLGQSLLTESSLLSGTYFIRLTNKTTATPGVSSYSLFIFCHFEPTTAPPTVTPTSAMPTSTGVPSSAETPTLVPSESPTNISPTEIPSASPTDFDPTTPPPSTTTAHPTLSPTKSPSAFPVVPPTASPTMRPFEVEAFLGCNQIAIGDFTTHPFITFLFNCTSLASDQNNVIFTTCNEDTVINTKLSLYDLQYTLIASADDGCANDTFRAKLSVPNLIPGFYFLRLSSKTVILNLPWHLETICLPGSDYPTPAPVHQPTAFPTEEPSKRPTPQTTELTEIPSNRPVLTGEPTAQTPILTCETYDSGLWPLEPLSWRIAFSDVYRVTFDACASTFDTILELYDASETTLLASDDDSCDQAVGQSILVVDSLPAGSYVLRLLSKAGPLIEGWYDVQIRCDPAIVTTTPQPTAEPTLQDTPKPSPGPTPRPTTPPSPGPSTPTAEPTVLSPTRSPTQTQHPIPTATPTPRTTPMPTLTPASTPTPTSTAKPTPEGTVRIPIGCDEIVQDQWRAQDVYFEFNATESLHGRHGSNVTFSMCNEHTTFDTVLKFRDSRSALLASDDNGCGHGTRRSRLGVYNLSAAVYTLSLHSKRGLHIQGLWQLEITCSNMTATKPPTTVIVAPISALLTPSTSPTNTAAGLGKKVKQDGNKKRRNVSNGEKDYTKFMGTHQRGESAIGKSAFVMELIPALNHLILTTFALIFVVNICNLIRWFILRVSMKT